MRVGQQIIVNDLTQKPPLFHRLATVEHVLRDDEHLIVRLGYGPASEVRVVELGAVAPLGTGEE